MATSKIQILIEADDKASAKLRAMAGGLDDLEKKNTQVAKQGTLRWTEFQSAILLAERAIRMVGQAANATVGFWEKNTLAIADFADKIGSTTEDASVIMEVADDLNVSLGALEMGFKTMARQGIQPSIEGLIQVKHRLDAAKSDSDRLAMAQKLLGRAGADLLPVFAQLNDKQLREYIENMGEGQIVTAAEAEEARKMRDALDDASDAWKNLRLQIGEAMAPAVTEWLNDISTAMDEMDPRSRRLFANFRSIWEATQNVGSEAHGLSRDFSLAAGAADDLTEAVGGLPAGGRTFTYSLKMQVPSDVQELARLMHWSIAKAAAYLIGGGAEAGATAEAFITAQNQINAPGTSKANTTFQHGGSFIVPGTGSGDRPYVLQLEPGERVDVTPRNQVTQNTSTTNDNRKFVFNAGGGGDEDLLSKFAEKARRA